MTWIDRHLDSWIVRYLEFIIIMLMIVIAISLGIGLGVKSAKHTAMIWNQCNPEVPITTSDAFWAGSKLKLFNCFEQEKSDGPP
jgi:hypothetical protein